MLDCLLTENPQTGRLHYRHALIGVARKNGKSAWASSLGLYALLFGGIGAEIYSCAGDKEQARIVFNTAKQMVEMDPELKSLIHVYRDALEVPGTSAVYRVLSSEAFTKEGLNPNLVIFDEVHVQPNDELWNVMELAAGARPEPLMLGITTAGVRTNATGEDSLCYGLYRHGQEVARGLVDDPSFFFAWWEPQEGMAADHRDPAVWREANPGIGDIVAEEDFSSVLLRTPESEFRAKRCNLFVSAQSSWLPYGAWEDREDRTIALQDNDKLILGIDGSYNNDATAIVAATVEPAPRLIPIHVWERTEQDPADWVVPIEDVEETIRNVCKRYRVLEVVWDPYRWARSMQVLKREMLPVVEYPNTPERMVPATQRFYEAVMNGGLSHNGDRVLARHIANATLRVDSRGSRLVKVSKGSSAKIDAAIAAVMAFDRAVFRGRKSGWLTYIQQEAAAVNAPAPEALKSGCEHRWFGDNCAKCGVARVEQQPEAASAVPPPPTPRAFFEDMPKVNSPVGCKHRWWDGVCVFCGASR